MGSLQSQIKALAASLRWLEEHPWQQSQGGNVFLHLNEAKLAEALERHDLEAKLWISYIDLVHESGFLERFPFHNFMSGSLPEQ